MKTDLVNGEKPKYLRTTVLWVLSIGGLGSLIKTIQAGRNSHSMLLISLFVIWVLSPFITLLVANLISKKWPFRSQVKLYLLSTFIAIVSLMAYNNIWTAAGTKKAFVFLIVPLLSWLLMIVAFVIIKQKKNNLLR